MVAKKTAEELLKEANDTDSLGTIDYNDLDKVFYPTDFYFFNILTGKNVRTGANVDYVACRARGFREGCMMLVVGDQGIGKTTWILNNAGAVKKYVDNHPNNEALVRVKVHVLTTEDGMEVSSIKKNMYADRTDFERGDIIMHKMSDVTTEYVADLIDNEYARKKKENKKN